MRATGPIVESTDIDESTEPLFRFLSEHTSDIVLRVNPAGRLLYVSPACRRLGYEPDALVGETAQSLVHPDDLAQFLRRGADVLRGRPPHPEDDRRSRIRTAAGDWVWYEGNPRVLRDKLGRAIEIINICRDVTVRREAEEALKASEARCRANALEAEAATAAKSRFLANMSHEIRTPLTAVIGFANLLKEQTDLNPDARRYVDRIGGASRALLAVVNDILDVSKLEAGQFTVTPRPTDAICECEETVLTFQTQAAAKGLDLSFSADPSVPELLMLDGDRLRQLVLNLVSNAVKFTDVGSVAVTAAYAHGALRFEVRDTGPGLTPAQQLKLFQRFSQVDESSTRRHGGAGLGLAICKGIVEAMNGEIGVSSEPGAGACLQVRLPAATVARPETSETGEALPSLAGLRVLVVDDNPNNRELARALLGALGVEVCDAADGPSGLELAATVPLDVILMDLWMPGMSGDQALAALRARPGPNRDIPVIAFTANADLEGRGDPALAGFDALVRKPIDLTDLCRALTAVTDWSTAAGRDDTEDLHVAVL